MDLDVLPGHFALCRLPASAAIPPWTEAVRRFLTMSRTADELSIVADAEVVPAGAAVRDDLRALRVRGPLPLEAVGILAALTVPLAQADIAVFAIATHDTDYLLLRESDLPPAVTALERAGHRVHALKE
jgi:hypothetical protein